MLKSIFFTLDNRFVKFD